MSAEYFPRVDMLYIPMGETKQRHIGKTHPPPAPVHLTDWCRIFLDHDGKPSGIEFDSASKTVPGLLPGAEINS